MTCKALTISGDQCGAAAEKTSNFCFRHNPEKKDEQLLASQKGGQNRALQGAYGTDVTLESPSDIRTFLGDVINGVWTGKVPVPVGTSMGFLAKCWLEAHSVAEMQSRIEKLEMKVGA